MECRADSVSGWRWVEGGLGRRADVTGIERQAEAPGKERMDAALKLVQGRICLMSHQKCLVWGSRSGKERVRTSDGVGFGDVRYENRVVAGATSGMMGAGAASGEGARGAYW
jgi:hypothetical protein